MSVYGRHVLPILTHLGMSNRAITPLEHPID